MSTARQSGSGNYSTYRNSGNYEGYRDNYRNSYRAPARQYYSDNDQNRDRNEHHRSQDGSRRNQGPHYYQYVGNGAQQQHEYRSWRPSQRDQESRSATPPSHETYCDDEIVKSYQCMRPNPIIGQIRAVILDLFHSKDRFVCRLHDDGRLSQMMQELQLESNHEHCFSETLNLGEICLAQSVRDSMWHRGIVARVEHEQYSILGLDTGISGFVAVNNVRGMKRKFCRLPKQAFICKLEGADLEWSNEDNDLLRRYFESDNLFCWFKKHPENDRHPVVLFLEEELNSIGRSHTDLKFLREKVASAEVNTAADSAAHENATVDQEFEDLIVEQERSSESFPLLFSHLTSLVKIVKEAEPVIISWVVSDYEFYCNLKMNAERMDELNENLQSVYLSEKGDGLVMQQLTPATCCAAKFYEDELWYRAEIQKVDGNEAQVLFVDYGNVETVNVDDLRQITEEFVQLPAQAVHCTIPSANHGRKLTSADVDSEAAYYFLSCNNLCYKVEESNNNNEGGHQASAFIEDLAAPDEQNQEDQFAIKSENAVKACEDAFEFETGETGMEEAAVFEIEEMREAIDVIDLDYQPESCAIFDLPRSRTQVYMLDPVTSPVDFWVQICGHACDLLEKVGIVNDIARMPLKNVNEGVVCASMYNEDGVWYRAKVIAKHSDSTSTVLYIDYGNTEVVCDTQLFALEDDIARIFPHAVHCQLANILLESSQTPEAVEKFVELTGCYTKILLVEFLDVDTTPYPVRLLDCGIDVAKTLATLGLCTYVEDIEQQRVASLEKDDEESAVDRTYSVDDEDSFLVCPEAVSGVQDEVTEIISLAGDEELIPNDMNVLVIPVSENIVGIDEINSVEEIPHNPSIEVFDQSIIEASISEARLEESIGGGYGDVNAEAAPESDSVVCLGSQLFNEHGETSISELTDSSVQVVCLDFTGEENLYDTKELCEMIIALECAEGSHETANSTRSTGTDLFNSSCESQQIQDFDKIDGETSLRDPGITTESDSLESTESVGIDHVVCDIAKLQILPHDMVTSAERISDNNTSTAVMNPLIAEALDETRNEHSPCEPNLEEITTDNDDSSNAKVESADSIACLDIPNVESSEIPVVDVIDNFAKCDETLTRLASRGITTKDGGKCNVKASPVDISQTLESLNADSCKEDMFHLSGGGIRETGDESDMSLQFSMLNTSSDANENDGSAGKTRSGNDAKNDQQSVEFADSSLTDASSNGARDTPRKLIARFIQSSDQEFEMQVLEVSHSETCDESIGASYNSRDSKSPISSVRDADALLGEAKDENSDDCMADCETSNSIVTSLLRKNEAISTSEDDGNISRERLVVADTDDENLQKLEVEEVIEVKSSEDEDCQGSDGTSSAKDIVNGVLITNGEDESSEGRNSSSSEDNHYKEISDEEDERNSEEDERNSEEDERNSEEDERNSEEDERNSEEDERTSEEDERTSEEDERTSEEDERTSEEDERNSEDVNANGCAMMTGSESEADAQPCDDSEHAETSECEDDDVHQSSLEEVNGNVLLTSTESEEVCVSDEEEVKSNSYSSGQEEVCDVEGMGTSANCATTTSSSNDSDQGMVCDDDVKLEYEDEESSNTVDTSSNKGSQAESVSSKLEYKECSISDELKSSVSEDEEGFAGDAEDENSSSVSEEECFVSELGDQNEDVSSSDLEVVSCDDELCDKKDVEVDDCQEMACSALEGEGDKKYVEFSVGEEDFFSTSDKCEDEKSNVCFEGIPNRNTQSNQGETCCDFETENAHAANNNKSVAREVEEPMCDLKQSQVPVSSKQLNTPADEEM